MRQFILLLFLSTCFHASAQQEAGAVLQKKEKTFRLRAAVGFAFFTADKQLKDHFNRYGYNDSYQSFSTNFFGSVIGGNGKNEHPVSDGLALVAEFSAEYRMSEQGWLGLVFGWDNPVSVKGYNRAYTTNSFLFGAGEVGHSVTLGHRSWYLSPQWSAKFPKSRLGFYAGPSLDFHTLDDNFQGDGSRKHLLKIGAMLGARVEMLAGVELFAAFRWSPELRFAAHGKTFEKGGATFSSTLPAQDVSFSYLRLGMSYRYQFDAGKMKRLAARAAPFLFPPRAGNADF